MGIFRKIFGKRGNPSGNEDGTEETRLQRREEQDLEHRGSKEKRREQPGLAAFELVARRLLAQFKRDFDPNDRKKTEDIYRQAKRLSALFRGAAKDVAYSGAFGDAESAMGRADAVRRGETAEQEARGIEHLILQLDQAIEEIEGTIDPGTLEAAKAPVEPLKPGHKKGVRPNDLPATQYYWDQIGASTRKVHSFVGALRDLDNVSAILRREDLLALSSAYRSLRLDRQFWGALCNDLRNPDPRFYNGGFWIAYDGIERDCLNPICDTYERAYSTDGKSEADKGYEWMLGARHAESPEDLEADLDGQRVSSQPDLERLTEQPPLFKLLEVYPRDLVGLTEEQIAQLLKRKYYKQAKTCHPDLFPGDKGKEERFKALDAAYDILRDPQRRSKYLRRGSH